MIQLNIGVPGSGKTYFVVKQIVDLALDKKNKYKKIYTNINGIQNNELSNLNKNLEFLQLDYDDLDFEAQKEYNYYLKNKKLDNYDDEVKKLGILSSYYNSLIVIDEAHTLLDDSEHIKRLITYHRHFDIDFIFLTQDKAAIDKVLLRNVEIMIVSVPPAKRFFPFLFRYYYYSSTKEYKTNLYQKQNILLSSKISKYYDSGSTKLSKSQLFRFIVPVVVFAFVVYFGYKNFVQGSFLKKAEKSSLEYNQTIPVQSQSVVNSDLRSVSIPQQDLSSDVFLKITCYTNDICRIKGNSYVFKSLFLKKLINDSDCTLKFSQTSLGLTDNVFSCTNEDLNLILGVLNDVKKSDNNRSSHNIF